MIDIVINPNLTNKDIGHHHKTINVELGYKKRGGMVIKPNQQHKGGRHPFNILTEEIYND